MSFHKFSFSLSLDISILTSKKCVNDIITSYSMNK